MRVWQGKYQDLLHLYQHGLEGHSRDPALERRNIVRGSGKKAQFLDGIRDLTATQEIRFAKRLAWDAVLGKKTIFEVACSADVFFGRALKGCYFFSPQSSTVIK